MNINRPKREDFYIVNGSSNTNLGWSDNERSYARALEEYCDELETKLAYIKDICDTGYWSDDAENAFNILDIISGRYKEWW